MVDVSCKDSPTDIPQLYSVKRPNERLNAVMFLPYPSDTPFGNMLLADVELLARIDYINVKLNDLYCRWELLVPRLHDEIPPEVIWLRLEVEEVIYWLQKSIDTLISATSILVSHRLTGVFPERIGVDDIGSLLNHFRTQPSSELSTLFRPYQNALELINAIANTYKHHFANHELVKIVGKAGPTAYYIHMLKNDSRNPAKFSGVLLKEIVKSCSEVIKAVREQHRCWLMPTEGVTDGQT